MWKYFRVSFEFQALPTLGFTIGGLEFFFSFREVIDMKGFSAIELNHHLVTLLIFNHNSIRGPPRDSST